MPFPQSFLDELIARNDIVDVVGSYVSLTPKGGSFWGCCPFHNEKSSSPLPFWKMWRAGLSTPS